jgi:L-ascorbate metabolism protein UlaG (beta-lactamase superfamily)
MDELTFTESLAEKLQAPKRDGITLYWLGQAGFIIDLPQHRIIIDPYLSNSLAIKYRYAAYSHERMMPPPVTADELGPVDLVLCTHHHTDHMDGETLSALAKRLPKLRFAVPAAAIAVAIQSIGVGIERLLPLDAGDVVSPLTGVGLHTFRAAHEALERDEHGKHRFLGYGLDYRGMRIFHSGDCIPFDGQIEEVSSFGPQVALLPVNGRKPELNAAGFAGNFSVTEAKALAIQCAIPNLIAHHYGMFAFNTVSRKEIDAASLTRAQTQVAYHLAPAYPIAIEGEL